MRPTLTFRRRIVVLAAAAVAAAVALAAVVTYVVVRQNLRDGVDATLRGLKPKAVLIRNDGKQVGVATQGPAQLPLDAQRDVFTIALPPADFGAASGVVQATLADGTTIGPARGSRLPVPREVRQVAAGRHADYFRDETVRGVDLRVFTTNVPGRTALQIATPLTAVDDTLGRLRWILLAVIAAGVGLASALGVGVSRAATQPLARLTAAADTVTATGELHHRIEPEGDDEPGRLAGAFNAMLGALQASRDAQRQLVADASHELRTPLTAIRANVELLERAREMPEAERVEVLVSVRGQLEDLTILVGDLVDLARPGGRPNEPPEELRLDELVDDAVARARRHASTPFVVAAEPCVVVGSRARLARAVGNLLDNAVKWSPPDRPIEVSVSAGEVTVRDHGPGISEADLPHVFDRFYRATAARGLPGSGLGLAIVKQVADTHGGSVSAELAPGGGARLRLVLPLSQSS